MHPHDAAGEIDSVPLQPGRLPEPEAAGQGDGDERIEAMGRGGREGAIAEFERGRIVERVMAGLARARAQGKRLGRRPRLITDGQFEALSDLSLRAAGIRLGVSRSVVQRWRLSRKPSGIAGTFASNRTDNSPFQT
jgi:hypothetical protein